MQTSAGPETSKLLYYRVGELNSNNCHNGHLVIDITLCISLYSNSRIWHGEKS